jgi:hypothetical protein
MMIRCARCGRNFDPQIQAAWCRQNKHGLRPLGHYPIVPDRPAPEQTQESPPALWDEPKQ